MRVKVREVGKGLHSSEVVVEIKTATGKERLVIDERSIDDNDTISVGSPIERRDDGQLLVELPRETMSGAWRVWVKEGSLLPEARKVHAA